MRMILKSSIYSYQSLLQFLKVNLQVYVMQKKNIYIWPSSPEQNTNKKHRSQEKQDRSDHCNLCHTLLWSFFITLFFKTIIIIIVCFTFKGMLLLFAITVLPWSLHDSYKLYLSVVSMTMYRLLFNLLHYYIGFFCNTMILQCILCWNISL